MTRSANLPRFIFVVEPTASPFGSDWHIRFGS